MNQPQSYMDVGPGHMSHSSVSSSASAPSHLHNYSVQHLPHAYGSSPVAYPGGYATYANGIGSIPSAAPSSGPLIGQPALTLPTLATNPHPPPAGENPNRTFDTSGQIAPSGMKPRVTATLWEDEGSLCFQVEAAGVCVARREDNHMINGTKLLNVAGMTRGRRDGILKSEKMRHVVKIGPMHLKGVWIPFERALDFANKEKITEQLYPLFVHNIGALLYHPQNNARQSISSATMASGADRRRPDGQPEYMRTPQASQPPTLQHAHSIANNGPQPPHSVVPHPASGRPGLDRAHTFPTPPASASSMMGMGNAGSSYEWGGAPVSAAPTTQSLSIDTGLSNTRSVPTTPASTPPTNTMQSMSNYQSGSSYDGSRQMYGHSSQTSYGSQYGMNRFAQLQPSPSVKNEMGPPARTVHEDEKTARDIYANHAQDQQHTNDVAEGEHDGDYTHAAGPYGQSRNAYGYNPHASQTSLHPDQSQVSPEMTGSPSKGSGRATPRAASNYASYSTPQRLPSSNISYVMSDNRSGSNGADMYGGGYQSSFQTPNGLSGTKRGLEMDDDDDAHGLKRQRTMHDDRQRPMVAHKKR